MPTTQEILSAIRKQAPAKATPLSGNTKSLKAKDIFEVIKNTKVSPAPAGGIASQAVKMAGNLSGSTPPTSVGAVLGQAGGNLLKATETLPEATLPKTTQTLQAKISELLSKQEELTTYKGSPIKEPTPAERTQAGHLVTDILVHEHPELVDPMEFFKKGLTFGWGDVVKIKPVTIKQETFQALGSLGGMILAQAVLSPIVGGILSKIPGVAKPLKILAEQVAKYPWKVGYPLSVVKSAAWGAIFGAVTKTDNVREWAKNIVQTAGLFAAFQTLAYPVIEFFRPVYYAVKSGKVTGISKETKTMLMENSDQFNQILTKQEPVWFKSETNPNEFIKVTQKSVDLVRADSSGLTTEQMRVIPFLRQADIEIFHYEPSLYEKLKGFLSKTKAPEIVVPTEELPAIKPAVPAAPKAPVGGQPVVSPIIPEIPKPLAETITEITNATPFNEVDAKIGEALKSYPAYNKLIKGDITRAIKDAEQISGVAEVPKLISKEFQPLIEEAKWEKGIERPFKFDPDSTVNEGRFRLLPPENIEKGTYFRRKSSTEGVFYVMGKNVKTGKSEIQAIRFNKSIMPKEKALKWWEANKDRFNFNQIVKGVEEKKLVKKPTFKKPEEFLDEIDKIIAGKISMRPPVSIKADWYESLGRGNYMRIFKGGRFTQTADEVADKLGMTEDELKEKIVQRLNHPTEDLEAIYLRNLGLEKLKTEAPSIGGSIRITTEGSITKPTTPYFVSQLRIHFNSFKERFEEIISKFSFYKNAPMELRNAIRIEVIGGLDKVYESRNKNQIILWGGMAEKDIVQSIEIIKLRDQLARIKADKGNPTITLEEAQKALDAAEKNASPEAIESAARYRLLVKKYTDDLIERGKLEPEEMMDDYMRHYVVDYTPEWVFNKGIPARLRQPFRGYLKKAGKTTKAYRVDSETILGQFLEMDHDNMIEDFIVKWSEHYNIKPKLSKEKLAEVLGVDKETGRTRSVKPGRIYIIDKKRYRGFNPSMPFGRVIFPTEEGLLALGRYRQTYLIPEEIYNAFRDFSEKGGWIIHILNKAVSQWKSLAILSHFQSFSINNMVGDTWMLLSQSPEPFKVLNELPVVFNYLVQKKLSPYLERLDKFIKDNDIVEGTYIKGELLKIRKARNPYYYILQKSQTVSQFRESILRIANASYLLKEMRKGNAVKLIKYFSYLGLDGLTEEQALGKIARDILVDYSWTSKTFNRWVRGFAFPFATWYFKGSSMMWKFLKKHWGRALIGFLLAPVLASFFNDRNKKTRELEAELPEFIQDRVHFILGENPDGSVRVLNLQLPQDALIGTKIFSIAVNQVNLVAIGAKSLKEAAVDTIKQWGIKEAKGIAYLTNFFARFFIGLFKQKDPYDNSPIYPMDPDKMSEKSKLHYQVLFFIKTTFPIINAYIKDYTLGKPIDVTIKDIIDKLVGLGALGINDIWKRDKVFYEGKEIEWEDYDKKKEMEGKKLEILDKLEDKWVASGLYPEDFIKTEEYKKSLEEMRDMYAEYVPEFKGIPIENIAVGLGETLTNRLGNSTDSARHWYGVQLEKAKTDEEKKKLGEKLKILRQQNLIDALNTGSRITTDVFLKYLEGR